MGDVIKNLLKVYGVDKKLNDMDVALAWKEVMGEPIANKTRTLKVSNKTLVIYLDSGVLKEEFSHAKQKIVKLMNDHLGRELLNDVKIY